MEQFEVLVIVFRIFVAFAQAADVVGVLQFFQARGITPEFLDILANRARILHTAMNHLFFAVTLELKFEVADNGSCHDRKQRDEQHQHQQDITLLPAAALTGFSGEPHRFYPWVRGMLWRLLLSTSSTSTEVGAIFSTL